MASKDLSQLPTDLDQENCVKRGLCEVAKDRSSQPYRLYYEIHGSLEASQKMVLIMGLNHTYNMWDKQVAHFSKKPNHSVLVFDNRGVGNSECGPREKYKTSEMAKDVIDLLDHLEWNQERSLHILGISMGGMIAQELSLLVPERIRSVSFISTKACDKFDLPSPSGIYMMMRMISGTVTEEKRIEFLTDCLFPPKFLDQTHSEGLTNREHWRKKFIGMHKNIRPQSLSGRFGQLGALVSHSCSEFKLKWMSEKLYPAKILVIGGDEDILIDPARIYELHDFLHGSELVMMKGVGHAPIAEVGDQFNHTLERVMQEGNERFS